MFNRIRAAWRALFGSTAITPVAVAQDAQESPARKMRISESAMWEANRHNAPVFAPQDIYRRPDPMPGVFPDGMAMDICLPDLDPMGAFAAQQLFHEGLGFVGYPYLAELSQRAEYRRIASIWAEHCTRKWVKVVGDDDKAKKIEAELDRLEVRARYREAIEKECFFGRMQLFLDFGDWSNAAELATQLRLKPEKINEKRPLKRLGLVEPMWSYPGLYESVNPMAPDFYKPSQWFVSGMTVHASRLITMVGHEMPNMLKPVYAFGGVSLTQMCKPYVDNWLRTRQSVSDIVHSFSVMVLKTDMDQVLQGAPGDALFKRVDMFNKTRDNRGTFVIDKNVEEFENVAAPISGLNDLLSSSQEQMSSVSGIPLVFLLGVTPSGLNASSEGEIRVFYDSVAAYVEKVCGPGLRTILEVVQLSLFGEIDPAITFEVVPLWDMSDKDKADIRKSDAEAHATYLREGVVDAGEVRECLANDETSLYHGIDLSGAAPGPPENEDEGENDGVPLPRAVA